MEPVDVWLVGGVRPALRATQRPCLGVLEPLDGRLSAPHGPKARALLLRQPSRRLKVLERRRVQTLEVVVVVVSGYSAGS